MELNAIKLRENEHLLGIVLPAAGKMPVEDLCALLNIKTLDTVKKIIREKQIMHHKIGYKWVIDLADFWVKTTLNPHE